MRALILLLFVATADAATFYVRTDGGTPQQCNGMLNGAYPGIGSGVACAWRHPFYALPPPDGGRTRIAGGDTLVIAKGSYMIGIGALGAESCDAGGSFACAMARVPSGPTPGNPTRIIGDCTAYPELWGTERVDTVIDLRHSSNIEIGCLDITDHSSCAEAAEDVPFRCQRDVAPYGPWAAIGIAAEDSTNVVLHDLDIHGLASTGIHAGRLTDWLVDTVRLRANGVAGWDGDVDGIDANSGTLTFRRWRVEWNGCPESFPEREPVNCFAQERGGYGDGVGTGETGGHWIIEDSEFSHNTSDGLDLLYCRRDCTIDIRRTHAEGNAGNPIKTSGTTLIENSVLISNCGFFLAYPFMVEGDHCRAAGNALSLTLGKGQRARVVNTTITGQGDCLVEALCAEGSQCDGSEKATFRNVAFIGQKELTNEEQSCLIYQEGLASTVAEFDHSLIWRVLDNVCPAGGNTCGLDPLVLNRTITSFDGHLLPGSPMANAGTVVDAPNIDIDGIPRDSRPDIGAYELRSSPPRRRAVNR